MSTNLPIELSENAYSALAQQASAVGTTPAALAASVVESIYAGHSPRSVDESAARAQFERCFGTVDLGRPIGIANESIDADLARAYGTANGSN